MQPVVQPVVQPVASCIRSLMLILWLAIYQQLLVMKLGLRTSQWNCCAYVNTHGNLVTIVPTACLFHVSMKLTTFCPLCYIRPKLVNSTSTCFFLSLFTFYYGTFCICICVNFVCLFVRTVTECLTSDIFSMLLHVCGVSDCIIVFSIVLAP